MSLNSNHGKAVEITSDTLNEVITSRSIEVAYQNTSDRPILVLINAKFKAGHNTPLSARVSAIGSFISDPLKSQVELFLGNTIEYGFAEREHHLANEFFESSVSIVQVVPPEKWYIFHEVETLGVLSSIVINSWTETAL